MQINACTGSIKRGTSTIHILSLGQNRYRPVRCYNFVFCRCVEIDFAQIKEKENASVYDSNNKLLYTHTHIYTPLDKNMIPPRKLRKRYCLQIYKR